MQDAFILQFTTQYTASFHEHNYNKNEQSDITKVKLLRTIQTLQHSHNMTSYNKEEHVRERKHCTSPHCMLSFPSPGPSYKLKTR